MKERLQKTSIIGGVVSSIIAITCCIGPIIYAVLGISVAGLTSKFVPFRPYLIGAALIFLAIAFYTTYKRKPAIEGEEGFYCAHPKSDRRNKILLWIATFIILGALTFPSWSIYLV